MSYLKDREIWLSSVPTDNPPAGYVWVFIQNGVFVVRDSNGLDKIMATTTGTVTNATSASYVEYSNVASKPALISGSSQVSYTGLSNTPAGIVSGSSQVTYSGLTGIPSGIVSSSAQIVGYNVFATTGSNQFNGSQAVTGSLTVTGQVVAQTLNVQQVTSSIVYSSGSNIFGNTLGNTQQFTGSVSVTGSLTTSIAAFGSAASIFLTSDSGTIKSRTAAQTLSDIAALPLAGGTLTGALTITNGRLNLNGNASDGKAIMALGDATYPTATIGAFNTGGTVLIAGQTGTGMTIGTSGQATFTGALSGTSATFSGALSVTIGGAGISLTGTVGSNSYYIMDQTPNSGKRWRFGHSGAVGGFSSFDFYNQTDNIIALTLASTGAATFSGDVAISKTSTYSQLQLIDNTASGSTWITLSGFPALGDYTIREAGVANHLVIKKTTGNVGIGTATPGYKLTVGIDAETSTLQTYTNGTSVANQGAVIRSWTYSTENFRRYTDIVSIGNWDGTNGTSAMRFFTQGNSTTPEERMRITSGGNVLFGTTDVPNGTSVYGSAFVPVSSGRVRLVLATNNTGNLELVQFFNPNGQVGSISTSGSLTLFTTTSDYRLKEDLQELNGLEKVQAIKVYDYKWKSDESRMDGVLAHELAEVLPYAVTGEKDAVDEDGTDKMQGVDYSKIVPILIKSIQELKSENDNLKSRLEVLEQS